MFVQSKEHTYWLEALSKVAQRFNSLSNRTPYVSTVIDRFMAYRNWPLTETGLLALVGLSNRVVFNVAIDMCQHCVEYETVSDEFILSAIEYEKKVCK